MNKLDEQKIFTTLQSVISPHRGKNISLHQPEFAGNEWSYVKECIDTGWVSSVGKYVDLFEEKLAEFIGVKKAVAVVNGTAALQISLKLAGVESADEILVPSLTFVATANAITYCNAVPHFVDVEESTLGVDLNRLDDYLSKMSLTKAGILYNRVTGRRIKALVVMHTFGHPVDLEATISLCDKYNLVLVEDAAESLGSYYKGQHTGSFGLVSSLSFNGNKILTTGGGGAVLTNDEELGKLAKHITTTAKIPHRWEYIHDMLGYNYRLPNINAALGCAQLEQLDRFLNQKRILAEKYKAAFQKIEGVKFFTEPTNCKSNYWLNTLIIDKGLEAHRDRLLEITNGSGIAIRPAWAPLDLLQMYQGCPQMDLYTTHSLAQRIINIPSSPMLAAKQRE